MGFKKTPDELKLAWAMGEWLQIEELLAMAQHFDVAIDNDHNTSSAAFELILEVRNDSYKLEELGKIARPLIEQRVHKGETGVG